MWPENCRLSLRVPRAEQDLKLFLTLKKRSVRQIVAIQFEQIERIELERHAGGDAGFQHGEVGAALAVDGDDLAVDQRGTLGQCLKRRQDHLELAGPVVAIAGVDHNLGAGDGDLGAIAVELHLEEPIAAHRYVVGQRTELERTKLR